MPPRQRITAPVNVRRREEQKAAAAASAPDTIPLSLAPAKGRAAGVGRHGDGRVEVVTPTTKEFGNSVGDRRWLEAAEEAGFIQPVDPAEGELPAGADWRYTGPMISSARFWRWPSDGRRCSGFSYIRDANGHYIVGEGNFPLKRPCAKSPILGGNVCIPHGGGIERVRHAAEMRLLGAADTVIGALITIALDTKADEKARVQAINSILDRAQVKGVTQVELEIPLHKEVIRSAFKRWGEAIEEGDEESGNE